MGWFFVALCVCIPALHCQTSFYVLSSAFIKHLAVNQGWHLELKICWSNNTSVMRGIKSIYWQSSKAHACTAFIAALRCTESNTDECDEILIPGYVHFSQFRQTSFMVLPKTLPKAPRAWNFYLKRPEIFILSKLSSWRSTLKNTLN